MAEEFTGGNGNGTAATVAANPDLRVLEQTLGEIKTLETAILLDRLRWAREHGVTFDGKRKEYEIFGYDVTISYKQYRDEYARGGIAGRVVDVMPDACWRGEPAFEIIEDEDPEHDTPFEQAWKTLDTKHGITSKLIRVDKLSRLSTYSVLLIGAPGVLDTELPKVTGPDALLYLKPFSGGGGPGANSDRRTIDTGALATIHEYEDDPQNERFGLPRTYKLQQVAGSIVNLPLVHWSRIVHVAEGLLEDDVFGQPALERVWNLLTDLRKVTGGGSEAFWLRANQGMHIDLDKDMQLADGGALEIAHLKEQAEAYKHQLDRWLRTRGAKVQTLGSDVANFANPADAVITQIAGSRAIPKRILTGSEMGELASSQDRENFKDQVNGRQTQHLAPNVVRQLVDRLIKYGFLPVPTKGERAYQVRWPHIQVLTEDEKSTGAQKWAGTKIAEDPVFTSAEVRDKWYGMAPLTAEQMTEIDDRKAEAVKRQQEAMAAAQPKPEEEPSEVFPRAAESCKFSSTQVQLPPVIARKLKAFGDSIPDEDLAEDGRERDAHVTVKYGLHTNKVSDVRDALAEFIGRSAQLDLTLGKVAYFTADDYDVVYVAVNSPDLKRLNKQIASSLDVTDTHPKYTPHATIAYVKSGLGKKYAGDDRFEGLTANISSIRFSPTEGEDTDISLGLQQRAAQAEDEELVRVLAAAIESGATEVIEAICGMRHA